jgi:outer membrane lipoprotein-sorting protein
MINRYPMKKLVLVVVMMVVVFAGRSQSFEGMMKWSMKLDITDPTMKAQMEELKKKSQDPATLAKMKELQDKMNDPQFKQMLDQNPQMKAQMEAALKMMAGGGMESMMPSGIVIKLKGNNSLSTIHGGIMDRTEVLHLADKDVTYTINHPQKTYIVAPKSEHKPQSSPKVTKTSETATILNYKCTKYIIETTSPDGKAATINYWATPDIKDIDLKALAKQQSKDQTFIYAEVDGFPMRIETTMTQGNLTMEIVEFKKGGVNASEFALPSGYTETKVK